MNNDSMFTYLVQRVYEDGVVTHGPFTGRHFTGWHRVTRYDDNAKTIKKFWLPPCHELMGVDHIIDGGFVGFDISTLRLNIVEGRSENEDEASRLGHGNILYGQPIHVGMAGIRRYMRQADLLESREGSGG